MRQILKELRSIMYPIEASCKGAYRLGILKWLDTTPAIWLIMLWSISSNAT